MSGKLALRVGSILALLGVGVLATRLANASWDSVVSYVSPFRLPDGEPEARPPLAERVVVVLVDGLRLDASRQMPVLNRLRGQGADLESTASAPSYSRPGRAVVATGAWSEIHGATTNFHRKPIAVDNLFRASRRAGRSCAVAGSLWSSLFAPELAGVEVREPPVVDEAGRYFELEPKLREYGRESAAFVAGDRSSLAVLDLLVTDYAAHEFGGRSEEYQRAALRTDAILESLVSGLDLGRTAILVTSDHGHLDEGGHGGPEIEVLAIPLVLAGEGIRRGFRGTARQIDVAPTVAALLGLPLPGAAQGRILLEALELDDVRRLDLLQRQWRQKAAFARAYLAGLGAVESDADAEPPRDPASLVAGIAAIERRVESVRDAREAAEHRARLPIFLLVLLIPLPALALLARRASRAALGAVAVAVVLYGLAFRFLIYGRGIRLALSAINHEEDVEPYFARIGALALLALGVALVAAFALACRWGHAPALGALSDLGLGIVAVVLYLLAVGVAVGHWRHGLFMEWHRAELGEGFGTFVALVQMQALGAAAVLVPVLAWLAPRLARTPARAVAAPVLAALARLG